MCKDAVSLWDLVSFGKETKEGKNLEDVAVQVFRILDFKGDFTAFCRDFASGLNIITLIPAKFARGGHQDDLFEVRDVDRHHMRGTRSRATRTGTNESMDVLVSINVLILFLSRRLLHAICIWI